MELYVAAIRGVFICESDQFIVFYWNRADAEVRLHKLCCNEKPYLAGECAMCYDIFFHKPRANVVFKLDFAMQLFWQIASK